MTDPRPNDGPRPFPAAPDSFEESSSSRFDAEVDFSSERPTSTMRGPRPSASVMRLVGGLVGGSLLLAGIVTLIRGDDEDETPAAVAANNPDVVMAESSLAAPLEHAIIALEPARMEAITASAVRGMTGKPSRRELARRETSTTTAPASTRPSTSTTSSTASHGTTPVVQPGHHADDATPARTVAPTSVPVRDLPPPPQPDAPSDDDAASDEPGSARPEAPAPSEPSDAPTKPSAPADEPAPSPESDDRSSAPS